MLYLNVLNLIYPQVNYIHYITNNKANANANLKVKTPALLIYFDDFDLLLKMLIKLIYMVLGNGFHSR